MALKIRASEKVMKKLQEMGEAHVIPRTMGGG